jgi:transcriptional regulator with XRE-family HTH domain
MVGGPLPSALRWLIGVELSHYRNQSGRTASAAAKHIGSSQGRLSHLEAGRNQQQPDVVEALLKFYGASTADTNRLVALAGTDYDQSWFAPWADVAPDWLHILIGLERLASKIWTYSTSVFPAMLQTEGYSLGVTEGQPRVRPDRVDQLVALRMERQRPVYQRDQPTELTSFLEESVVDRPPTRYGENGGWALLRDQLEQALAAASRPTIEVRVVPTAAGPHPAIPGGPFTLLDFRLAQSVVYAEGSDNAVYVHSREQVRGYHRLVEQLQDVALSPADTIDFLRARIARLS